MSNLVRISLGSLIALGLALIGYMLWVENAKGGSVVFRSKLNLVNKTETQYFFQVQHATGYDIKINIPFGSQAQRTAVIEAIGRDEAYLREQFIPENKTGIILQINKIDESPNSADFFGFRTLAFPYNIDNITENYASAPIASVSLRPGRYRLQLRPLFYSKILPEMVEVEISHHYNINVN